jgi:hypothetical protein
MLTEEEFREELHRRVGERLDDVHAAPALVDRLRARQARRTALARSGSAVAAVAVVSAIVVSTAFGPRSGSRLPSPPVPAASGPRTQGVSPTVVPSPSTAVMDMSRATPLVTSGPCKGLAIGLYQWSTNLHPPVTALTRAGLVLEISGARGLGLKAAGPCVSRLSYVTRTGTFDDLVNEPRAFIDGAAGLSAESSPQNQTGLVQFFLDCKGLVCSGSGAPLSTLTVHVRGTAPGAASVPFAALPSPLPLPPGDPVTIPSVIGLTPQQAEDAMRKAGVYVAVIGGDGAPETGTVAHQEPPAGSVVTRGAGVSLGLTGGQPFTPPPRPPAATAHPSVAPTSAVPADPTGDVPFIRWPQRGELVNTVAPLDAEVAWDTAKGPHHGMRIVYAGTVGGLQGVIVEGDLRMALLVRATPDAPFTVLDDRFVRQNGGLRQLSAMGRPLRKGGTPAPYQIVFAVVHPGDVVSVKSPGIKPPRTPSYAILTRVPLSATRADTSLVVTGANKTVSVPVDPSSG